MNKIFKFFLASSFGLLTFTFGVFGSEESQELYECSVISEKSVNDFTVVSMKDYNKDLQKLTKDLNSDWGPAACYFLGRLFAILDCTSNSYIKSIRKRKLKSKISGDFIIYNADNCNKMKTLKNLAKALPTITSYGEKYQNYSIFEKTKRMVNGENSITNWQDSKYYALDGGDICIPATMFSCMDAAFLGDVNRENIIGGRNIKGTYVSNIGSFKMCIDEKNLWWLEYKSPNDNWIELEEDKIETKKTSIGKDWIEMYC